jgi:hypothetical protein
VALHSLAVALIVGLDKELERIRSRR